MITLSLLLIFGFIFLVMLLNTERRVPWVDDLKRVNAGVPKVAEWTAPEGVIDQVRQDYLASANWLHDASLSSYPQQVETAPRYLSSAFLKYYRAQLDREQHAPPLLVGVLRAMHHVDVRHFSESGEHCLVVDTQTERRITTYIRQTHERVANQHIPSTTLVFTMQYDNQDNRWKIAQFVQELPIGWQKRTRRLHLQSIPLQRAGRDN